MDDVLYLSYNVFELPTAQHRAGLAGLLVHLHTMRQRGLTNAPDATPEGEGSIRLTLTRESLAAMLNDLYEATTDEITRPRPFKARDGTLLPPLRTESIVQIDKRSGKETEKTVYVYPQVTPLAPFLQSMDMPEAWLKLWREVVWSTLRGIPRTRGPYEQRAKGIEVGEAAALWNDLQKWQRAMKSGRAYTTEVSSTLFIGAQAFNAERVPFLGSPDENLLLHFWPIVMGVGEARKTALDHGQPDEKSVGYVITVPNVNDLHGFHADFVESVALLDRTMAGYRPRGAILSLPEEGGLQYLSDLATVAKARAVAGVVRFSVAGVEVYQLIKRDKTVAVLSTGRIQARPHLVDQYEQAGRRYYDLAFRGQVIRNLLRDQPWYDGFQRVFAKGEWGLFVGPSAGRFASDVRRKFRTEFDTAGEQEADMDADTGASPSDLSRRVHRMIRQYVEGRTEAKTGLKWADFKKIVDPDTGKGRVDVPEKYREAREKVCQGAFLAIRGCRARQDFVAYFTGTICAVPQFVPFEEYQSLAAALLGSDDQWEHVKALSMLALSASSRV